MADDYHFFALLEWRLMTSSYRCFAHLKNAHLKSGIDVKIREWCSAAPGDLIKAGHIIELMGEQNFKKRLRSKILERYLDSEE